MDLAALGAGDRVVAGGEPEVCYAVERVEAADGKAAERDRGAWRGSRAHRDQGKGDREAMAAVVAVLREAAR